MVPADLDWDYPEPHVIEHIALDEEADGYGHINNSVYLQWLDQCVWDHCEAVGMSPKLCRELNRGFAATRHEIDYLRAVYPGDHVAIGNWVTLNDKRLRAERRFQIIRVSDGQILLRAKSYYVCRAYYKSEMNLKPHMRPPLFSSAFMPQERPSNQCAR